jgi:hypothetical protein
MPPQKYEESWERKRACSRFMDDFGNEWFPYHFEYDTYMTRYYYFRGTL